MKFLTLHECYILYNNTFRTRFLLIDSVFYFRPLPFPVDSKDAAFAALQELHRRHDMNMLRLVTQGHINGSASSLLYPMMTQQILLAMTQQFYSLYNVPDWSPTTKCAVPKSEPSDLQTRRPAQPSPDHSVKKRKSSEISDCALDLSLKRPKTEMSRSYKTPSYPEVTQCDTPLDFSMKKMQYPHHHSNSNNKSVNHKMNSTNVSTLSSEHSLRWSNQLSVPPTKSVPATMCTCGKAAADDDITSWSVEQVCFFIQSLDGCAGYAKVNLSLN